MKIAAVVLLLTLVWLLLVSVRDGRGRATAIDGSHAWMLEQHERVVQLGQTASIPADHPLSRLELGDRQQQPEEVLS